VLEQDWSDEMRERDHVELLLDELDNGLVVGVVLTAVGTPLEEMRGGTERGRGPWRCTDGGRQRSTKRSGKSCSADKNARNMTGS
jgi:hypothetical protein